MIQVEETESFLALLASPFGQATLSSASTDRRC